MINSILAKAMLKNLPGSAGKLDKLLRDEEDIIKGLADSLSPIPLSPHCWPIRSEQSECSRALVVTPLVKRHFAHGFEFLIVIPVVNEALYRTKQVIIQTPAHGLMKATEHLVFCDIVDDKQDANAIIASVLAEAVKLVRGHRIHKEFHFDYVIAVNPFGAMKEVIPECYIASKPERLDYHTVLDNHQWSLSKCDYVLEQIIHMQSNVGDFRPTGFEFGVNRILAAVSKEVTYSITCPGSIHVVNTDLKLLGAFVDSAIDYTPNYDIFLSHSISHFAKQSFKAMDKFADEWLDFAV